VFMGMGGSTREYSHRPENLDFPAWKLRAPNAGRLSGLLGAILLIAVVTQSCGSQAAQA